MIPTDDQRALCPINSPSAAHYGPTGCRCQGGDAQHVDWMIANARSIIDRRREKNLAVSQSDRVIDELVEVLDAYRETLVRVASDGWEISERRALAILIATGADGPVTIPPEKRGDYPADLTMGDRKARMRRALREHTP
jgi:hypothetical protein